MKFDAPNGIKTRWKGKPRKEASSCIDSKVYCWMRILGTCSEDRSTHEAPFKPPTCENWLWVIRSPPRKECPPGCAHLSQFFGGNTASEDLNIAIQNVRYRHELNGPTGDVNDPASGDMSGFCFQADHAWYSRIRDLIISFDIDLLELRRTYFLMVLD
ncbi:hypothetical protein BJV74DRAFT_904599 [Russula compacta]|nr:hypothetical protein BJV74DRAFT_904599 [Russula compacta]